MSAPRHGQAQVLHLPCGSHSAWFVAETHPGRDAEAIERLQDQGFTAYQPSVLERRTIRRKSVVAPVPMFPGYLFVALDLTAPGWRSAFHTRGIRAFLCHAPERPTPVPAAWLKENDKGKWYSLAFTPKDDQPKPAAKKPAQSSLDDDIPF